MVCADMYKTVDENGQVIFTDKPTAKAEQVEVNIDANTADALSDSAYLKTNDIKSKKTAKNNLCWCIPQVGVECVKMHEVICRAKALSLKNLILKPMILRITNTKS